MPNQSGEKDVLAFSDDSDRG